MRMFSVIGAALALATCLAFALPASAADVLDHPACGYELVNPAATADGVCVLDLSPDIIPVTAAALSPADSAPITENCSASPAWASISTSDGNVDVLRLESCRRYDPGWRTS